jgi:membrane protein DedA with SNARE-associated domain
VFFGRMVPIVRSFISVPAGVVRMPFGQFLLFTTAGSLIWNSVLIGLGVAAGDFVRDNLKYLDYAVVAAVALGIGYLSYKRAMDVRRHRRERVAGRAATVDDADGAR